MNSTESREYLTQTFAKIGNMPPKYIPKENELEYLSGSGVKKFKRQILGRMNFDRIKTLDEITETILNIGIAKTKEEATTITPKILEAFKECSPITCGNPYGIFGSTQISICKNTTSSKQGQDNYLIIHRSND
jgi:hypothetical protein